VDAVRLQQELDGFEDRRLIIGDENTDSSLLTKICHGFFYGLASIVSYPSGLAPIGCGSP
jgi:hypothetical protein